MNFGRRGSALHGPLDVWPTPPVPPAPTGDSGQFSIAPFQRRSAYLQRIAAAEAKEYETHGFITMTGFGTGVQEVNFPVRFLEMPNFVTGWSLLEGQQLIPQKYPSVDAGVARWKYDEHTNNVRYYAGAFIAVTVSNVVADQQVILHWRVTGKTIGTLATSTDHSADGTT